MTHFFRLNLWSVASVGARAYLQCLKETFADPGEILRLEWRDIKDNIITINHPVKGHLPGQVEVSNRLLSMLNALPKTSKLVFPTSYAVIRQCLQELRKRAAMKLQNPNCWRFPSSRIGIGAVQC